MIAVIQMNKNPFPYSLDNKRYQTWNYYLKQQFGHKVAKVPIHAYFTCPNRDGTKGYGGCSFCSAQGSGDFPVDPSHDLMNQFQMRSEVMKRKWPNCYTMAYFQSFTNTYAPLDTLKKIYDPFMEKEDIVGICIGTRPDCLSQECVNYLAELATKKEIWVELGLQTIHEQTAQALNRGCTYTEFLDAIERLSHTNIHICVHIINGLPNETKQMMLETVEALAKLPIHALKIHMLHIVDGSQMAVDFKKQPWSLLTREEYVDIVIEQLELLPPTIILQRLTGDGMEDLLLGPAWTQKKTIVLNEIDKEMVRRNTWQGKKAGK